MPHLVHECRFIRTIKERNDAFAVLLGDFPLHILTEHLVELLNDGDRLVVEDDIAATVTAPVIGNTLDTIFIEFPRYLFRLPFLPPFS